MAQQYSLDLEAGSSQYLSITDASQTGLDITGNFTVTGWIKLESTSSTLGYSQIILGKDVTSSSGYQVRINSSTGKIDWVRHNAATSVSSTTSPSVGVWCHFAFTFDGTNIKIFFNGIEEASAAYTAHTGNTEAFEVGRSPSQTTRYFDGLIKDLRVYNSALTNSEILTDAHKETTSKTSIQGEWNLNNAYTDSSGNGNTLTANGSPVFGVDVPWRGEAGVSSTDYVLQLKNASNQYADASDINLTSSFTLEAWVAPKTFTTESRIISNGDNSSESYFMSISTSGYVGMGYEGQAQAFDTNKQLKAGEWTHIAVVHDDTANTDTIYVNGVVATTFTGRNGNPTAGSGETTRVGGHPHSNNNINMYDGLLKDVRIFNDARTQTEIISDANSDTVTDANLQAEWQLNNAYTDGSGNGYTLTSAGSPVFVQWDTKLAGGLVSYWEMEETSGTRVDSHNSNDLADNNTVTSATGIRGTAGQFTRANSEYLSITDASQSGLDLTNNFSIAGWFYLDSATTAKAYVLASKKGGATTKQYVLKVSSAGTIALQASSTGSSFDRDTNISWTETTGAWHFLVITWKDGSVNYYMDGKSLGAAQAAGGTTIVDSTGDFNMGREATGADHFDGRIDEFAIYNRVLDYGDILDLYNDGAGLAYVPGTNYTQSIVDTMTLVDSKALKPGKVLEEVITLVDGISRSMTRILTEVITLVDTVASNLILTKQFTEAIVLVDTQALQTGKAIEEVITLVDSATRLTTRTFEEVITLVDTIATSVVFTIELADALTLVDSAIRQTGKLITDVISLVDVQTNNITIAKTFTEVVTLVDSVTKSLARSIADSLTLVDSLAKVLTGTVSLVEQISITDRLYGLLNGVNMKWIKKYAEKAGTFYKKYLDI